METNSDILIIDTIDAHTVEEGDQIILDGEPIEVSSVGDDPSDPDGIVIQGYSWDEGDYVSHTLPYDYRVDVWSI